MAYDFTAASSQYLSTASAPVTSVPFTMACWMRPSNAGSVGVQLSLGDIGSNNRYLIYQSANTIYAAAASSSTLDQSLINNGSPPNNTWGHTAAVFAATNSRQIYFNGTAGTLNTGSVNPTGIDSLLIAGHYADGVYKNFFDGDLAEVGIWNAALTAAEIASLAKGMTCDKIRPQNLVFYAPLVRNLIDQKNGLTITNNNGATVATHPRVYA